MDVSFMVEFGRQGTAPEPVMAKN